MLFAQYDSPVSKTEIQKPLFHGKNYFEAIFPIFFADGKFKTSLPLYFPALEK